MSEFYTKAEVDALLKVAKQEAVEQALRALPFVMKSLLANMSVLKEASEKFYKDNKDLQDCKELVSKTMEKVEAANPGFTLDQVLASTAKEVRKLKYDPSLATTLQSSPPSQIEMNTSFNALLEEMK